MGRDGGGVSKGGRAARVALAKHFVQDVKAQVAFLREQGRNTHTGNLRIELNDVRALLATTPHAGREIGPLRQILLRTLPFVVWYRVDRGRVLLVRLFHARQPR
ncbi:MAG: type II toxin-antitoxin system RelE/ParE family toxin [Myxococcaceae bacterium]